MDATQLMNRLEEEPGVAAHPGLAQLGAAAFAYAQVLLDDDDNLTRIGNPTGAAKKQLRERIEELLAQGGAAQLEQLDDLDDEEVLE